MNTKTPGRPFWKEPMMWVVIGLPLASVVAGIWLVVTSVRSGGSDAVTDNVKRVAQIQTTDLGPDAQAQQLKLSAVLQLRKGHAELIPVTGEFGEAPLILSLAHPTRETEDKQLVLQRTDSGWGADFEVDASHDWNLQLTAEDGKWRLRGRLLHDTAAARLAPAHDTP